MNSKSWMREIHWLNTMDETNTMRNNVNTIYTLTKPWVGLRKSNQLTNPLTSDKTQM